MPLAITDPQELLLQTIDPTLPASDPSSLPVVQEVMLRGGEIGVAKMSHYLMG